MAALFLAAIAIGLLRDWELSVASLGFSLMLVILAKLPVRWYLLRMMGLTLFLLLFLAWPVFFPAPDEATVEIGTLVLGRDSLFHLIGVLSRALAMVSLVLVHLATTPLPDTFKAAHSLRVPGLLVQVLMLTYRYLFLLGEEFRRLRTALRVRGFRNRAAMHSYRTIGQVAGTLLVRSLDRAERVAHAMRARGFEGQFRSLNDFQTTWRDVVFFIVVVGLAGGMVALSFFV